MADDITAKDGGKKFDPHPEGTFASVCVDTINLGERVESFGGKTKVQPKCALVFTTGQRMENGEPFYIHPEFTVSMGELANLRRFMESWRGKSYTAQQAEAGVPLHKLVGQTALITIEHLQSAKGRTYAKVRSISPLPKEMPAPSLNGYKRPEWWTERKEEYAKTTAAYKASTMPVRSGGESFDDFPEALNDNDDDFPF